MYRYFKKVMKKKMMTKKEMNERINYAHDSTVGRIPLESISNYTYSYIK